MTSKPESKQAPTPGPWTACKNGECSCGFIWAGDNNTQVATAHGPSALGQDWFGADLAPNEAAQKANAHLIAAAPDLLAALEDVMAWIDERRIGKMDGDWSMQRAALSKSRGEG